MVASEDDDSQQIIIPNPNILLATPKVVVMGTMEDAEEKKELEDEIRRLRQVIEEKDGRLRQVTEEKDEDIRMLRVRKDEQDAEMVDMTGEISSLRETNARKIAAIQATVEEKIAIIEEKDVTIVEQDGELDYLRGKMEELRGELVRTRHQRDDARMEAESIIAANKTRDDVVAAERIQYLERLGNLRVAHSKQGETLQTIIDAFKKFQNGEYGELQTISEVVKKHEQGK